MRWQRHITKRKRDHSANHSIASIHFWFYFKKFNYLSLSNHGEKYLLYLGKHRNFIKWQLHWTHWQLLFFRNHLWRCFIRRNTISMCREIGSTLFWTNSDNSTQDGEWISSDNRPEPTEGMILFSQSSDPPISHWVESQDIEWKYRHRDCEICYSCHFPIVLSEGNQYVSMVIGYPKFKSSEIQKFRKDGGRMWWCDFSILNFSVLMESEDQLATLIHICEQLTNFNETEASWDINRVCLFNAFYNGHESSLNQFNTSTPSLIDTGTNR